MTRKLYVDVPNPTVTIDEYQQQSYRTAPRAYKELTHRQFELVHAVLGLCTEVGELADTVKKHVIYRQPLDTENLIEEEGDVDWYLALLASAINSVRSLALERNIAKLRKRYPDGYTNQAAKERADKQDAPQTLSSNVDLNHPFAVRTTFVRNVLKDIYGTNVVQSWPGASASPFANPLKFRVPTSPARYGILLDKVTDETYWPRAYECMLDSKPMAFNDEYSIVTFTFGNDS